MGQKTIPQSLRLAYLKNWTSEWVSTTSDYSKIFYLEYTLRQYLNGFCKRNNLYLHKLQVQKTDQTLNIYLYFYNVRYYKTNLLKSFETYLSIYINNYLITLNLKESLFSHVFLIPITFYNLNLHKRFKIKKKALAIRRLARFKNISKIMYIAFYLQNPGLLSQYLIKQLKTNKRHKQFLRNTTQLLNKQLYYFKNCVGYRLEFNGRVNGRSRAKPYVINTGQTPSNTIASCVKYNSNEVLTPSGMCNLKIFFYFKK